MGTLLRLPLSVVRIEAPGTIDLAIEPAAADLILGVLSTSPSALQIDFDARRSQRDFYTAPLRDLRRRMSMPKRYLPRLPLSLSSKDKNKDKNKNSDEQLLTGSHHINCRTAGDST